MKRRLLLALILVVFVSTFAAGSGCPGCFDAEPQGVIVEPSAGGGKGFSISLEMVADMLLEALGASSRFTTLLPTVSVERIGAITGSVQVSGCGDYCSDPAPRLAVATTIESEGVAQSVLPVELIRSAAHSVNVQVIGPTILDIRDDVEGLAARADAGVATLDENPSPWTVKVLKFTIQGQGTRIKLGFWGLFSTAIEEWQESDDVQTRSDILRSLGPNDLTISETRIGDVIPHCLCVRDAAEAESVDVDEAVLAQTNEAPFYSFKTDILLSLPGTTVIPGAFTASDSEGDHLHFFLDVFGVPEDRYTYTIDPETGTMVLAIGGMSQEEIDRAVQLGRSSTLYVFDLKDGADVPANTWPPEDSYHHKRSGDLRVTFTVAQPPEAVDKEQEMSIPELRDGNGYAFEAIFPARDLSPDDAGMCLGIRVREDQEFSNLRMVSASVDPGTGSGLGIYPVDGEGIDATHYAKARFEYVGDSQNPPPPGEYKIEFEVYKMILSTGEQWGLDVGTYTLHLTNTDPEAHEDAFDNVWLRDRCGYAESVEGNVRRNDSDPDGPLSELSVELIHPPEFGILVTLDSDGDFLYIIDPQHLDGNWFSYRVVDRWGGTSEPAIVDLILHPPAENHPPALTLGDFELLDQPGEGRSALFWIMIHDVDFDCVETTEEIAVWMTSELAKLEIFLGTQWMALEPSLPIRIDRTTVLIERSSDTGLTLGCRASVPAGTHSWEVLISAEDASGARASERLTFTGLNCFPQTLVEDCHLPNPEDCWVARSSSSIDGQCASIGPLCFTMEPDWYEAGCLQFRDLDGDPLTFRLTQMPRFGTVNLLSAGSRGNYSVTVMYEIDREKMLACHRARTNLVDQITVQASDPYGGFAEAQMNFDFEVVNTPPTCVDDTATTLAGVPVTIDVLANDSDADGDPLSAVAVGTPAGGGACVVDDEIVYTPDPNVCGADSFSYTADDDYGGQATAWVSVDVIDNVPPVAVCQPATVYLGPDGTAVLDLEALDGGSTDNCGIVGCDASEKLFDCGNLGDCPVLFTVYDGAGHSDSCWTTVTVVDEIDPAAVGQDLTVFLDEAATVTVLATQVENGSTDNCAVSEVLIDGASEIAFGCAELGIHDAVFTARDASGNEHSVDIVLTVADAIPPVARCQDLIVSLDATGQVTVSADAVDAGSTDNCGIASKSLDRDTFFESDIGDQTVTLIVTDTSGNTDTCTATITVQDDMAPSLTCPPDKTVSVDAGACSATDVDLGTPTATDNTQVDWSTLENDAPDEFPIGDTRVRWSVADLYGNVGHCEQRVTVTEAVDPAVSCPGDMTVYTHDEDGETVTFSATATDTCDPDPQVTCVPSSGSTFPIGDTLVTCTATDNSGNTDTCTFTVTVVYQNDPPVAADDEDEVPEGGGCIDIDVLANDTDPDGDELTVTQAGTPTCGTTEVINDGGAVRYCTEGCSDPPDTVTFTYTITDGHGSTDTASVSVDMPEGGIIFFMPPPPED